MQWWTVVKLTARTAQVNNNRVKPLDNPDADPSKYNAIEFSVL